MTIKLSFEDALKRFVTHTSNSMKFARICAELALLHYEEHGDLCHCQSFIDAMPKNYVRRAAFLKWLNAYSPVTMEAGKLAKDKAANAVPFNTEVALAIPFWDYAPDKETVTFGPTDVVTALERALKPFHGQHKAPKDKAAVKSLEMADKVVEQLKEAAIQAANTASVGNASEAVAA